MKEKNLPTFNERCKQVIRQAREANPTDQAVIGYLAMQLVLTQNTVALNLQRLRLLLEEMEQEHAHR